MDMVQVGYVVLTVVNIAVFVGNAQQWFRRGGRAGALDADKTFILLQQLLERTQADLASARGEIQALRIELQAAEFRFNEANRELLGLQARLQEVESINKSLLLWKLKENGVEPGRGRRRVGSQLLSLLTSKLSLTELKEACFEADISFDTIEGESMSDKALNLVTYLARREGSTAKFIEVLKELRPDVEWPVMD
jgi:hypothetical protein